MTFPIYANEMFPPSPDQLLAPRNYGPPAPMFAPNPFAQMPDQRAYMGLEITGNELDHLLAMSGAAAYGSGQEIFGALPSRASVPPWMAGAAAYGADTAPIPPTHPAHPAHPHHAHYVASMARHAPPGVTPRAVDVQMQAGTHVRRQSLGLSTTSTVPANGGAGQAQAQPQVPFRPEKLVIPSDLAGNFDVSDVKVGKDSQFVAPGIVPARAFDEKAVDNLLSFHASAISQIITVSVINNGGVATTFKCYMTGTSVE